MLLRGRGRSTLRTPKGAELEVLEDILVRMIFFCSCRSIEIQFGAEVIISQTEKKRLNSI